MDNEKLKSILSDHAKYLDGNGGNRANLSGTDLGRANLIGADLYGADLYGADLSGASLSMANLSEANLSEANLSEADLYGANLSRANLSRANLSRANLSGADFRWADLSGADFRWANLSRANLSMADLGRANLSMANLSMANLSMADLGRANLSMADLGNTCLDPELRRLARLFARECPATHTGGRIVYRTAASQHIRSIRYAPGHTYVAPVLSWDVATECHPGIYAASLRWIQEHYPYAALVRCYVRDGDWIITAKGAIRCSRIRVLNYVKESEVMAINDEAVQ